MKQLPIVTEVDEERTALSARWPEPVLALSDEERAARVRSGTDTVMLDDGGTRRGFVRAVLTVPLGHPRGAVFGVFVEVDKAAYAKLQKAHKEKTEARVWGTLATRLPYPDDAIGAEVEIVEDGSDRRARVVASKHHTIVDGPEVGDRARGPRA
jgi:hypothetical protein